MSKPKTPAPAKKNPSDWSPNGFKPPNCTWYADGYAKNRLAWSLLFKNKDHRDARTWCENVLNAEPPGKKGHPGDIMVLGKFSGTPEGHVAIVKSSKPGKEWEVTHANFPRGKAKDEVYGVPIYEATFVDAGKGMVKVKGGGTLIPLLGFLYKKKT